MTKLDDKYSPKDALNLTKSIYRVNEQASGTSRISHIQCKTSELLMTYYVIFTVLVIKNEIGESAKHNGVKTMEPVQPVLIDRSTVQIPDRLFVEFNPRF